MNMSFQLSNLQYFVNKTNYYANNVDTTEFYYDSNRFISPPGFTFFRGVVSADDIKTTLIIFGQFTSFLIVETKRKAHHLPFTFKFRTNRVNGDHYLVKLSLIVFILKQDGHRYRCEGMNAL